MTQPELDKLMQAILADDPAALDAVLGQRKNVCLGRFPILSLCYMYHSARIVRAYAGAMQQGPRVVLPEPVGVYRDFARLAGRALRYFAGQHTATVEPIYMLALLGQWRVLRRYCIQNKPDEDQKALVVTLVRVAYGVTAHWQGRHPVLPPKPLPRAVRPLVLTCTVLVVVLLCVAVASLALGIPAARRLTLHEGAQSYVLDRDVTLDGHIDRGDMTIEGEGHTITVPMAGEAYMQSFYGTVRNCTLHIVGADLTLHDQWAVWCVANYGTWENVRVVVEGPEAGWTVRVEIPKEQQADGTLTNGEYGYGLLCVDNYGTVLGCSIQGTLRWAGDGNSDAQFGAVAAHNYGTIDQVQLDATIDCDTVDVGGLVFRNEAMGSITDCTLLSTGSVGQNTSVFQWSPMVGGIAAINYGMVQNCGVHSPLYCTKSDVTFPAETITPTPTVCGGIAGYNYGVIRHCVVTADLLAGSATANLYGEGTHATVGGIAGEHIATEDGTALLEQNIAQGTVQGKGIYNYVGGLVGTCSGAMRANCFGGIVTTGGYYGTLAGVLVSPSPQTVLDGNLLVQLRLNDLLQSLVPVVGFYTTGDKEDAGATLYEAEGATSLYIGTLKAQKEYWYEE